MVNNHSDRERGNPLPPHRLLLPVSSKVFYMHHPTDILTHTTEFVTPVVEHWLEREIAQWVHPMKDRSDDPSHHERTPLPRSYISLLNFVLTMVAVFACEKSLKLRRKKRSIKVTKTNSVPVRDGGLTASDRLSGTSASFFFVSHFKVRQDNRPVHLFPVT